MSTAFPPARTPVQAVAVTEKAERKAVPLELEEGEMPLNTFSPKKSFIGKVISVERIVGPKATGETCNVVIETRGEIPYWEGQSYGVIPPVCSDHSIQSHCAHQIL